jgi:site-specific DNA-methyltransferase (adenine-specific)
VTNPVTIGRATLYLGDCRDILPTLPKVDAVIADIPYATTAASWDVAIPFDDMWRGIAAVAERETPIVLFGAEPFSSALRLSNSKMFKHDWIWEKPKATGFLNAKKRPLSAHEIISVFGLGQVRYFPQKTQGHERKVSFRGKHLQAAVYGEMQNDYRYDSTERYPRSVIKFAQDTQSSSEHDTQKPVELMRYLVKTYSQPSESVLDFTMGSGTTGVACQLEGRAFIGIEREERFFDIACKRIEEAQRQGDFFVDAAA